MRSKFMHWSSILFLKKRANTKLYEKFPSNLKIAKLSVSYSNYFFNLRTLAFIRTFVESSSKQMNSH